MGSVTNFQLFLLIWAVATNIFLLVQASLLWKAVNKTVDLMGRHLSIHTGEQESAQEMLKLIGTTGELCKLRHEKKNLGVKA